MTLEDELIDCEKRERDLERKMENFEYWVEETIDVLEKKKKQLENEHRFYDRSQNFQQVRKKYEIELKLAFISGQISILAGIKKSAWKF